MNDLIEFVMILIALCLKLPFTILMLTRIISGEWKVDGWLHLSGALATIGLVLTFCRILIF